MTEKKKEQPVGGAMRLAKSMAHRGICSRREADELILAGWVKVNGEIIRQKGFKVGLEDEITLAQEALGQLDKKIAVLLNKPVGYVSGQAEKGYKAAAALVRERNHWSGDPSRQRLAEGDLAGLVPAGRLDIDSHGLLVLTNDGKIARTIIAPNSGIEKEYLVRVEGTMIEGGLAFLNHGLSLDGEMLRPAKVKWQNKEQLQFKLRQGKKRQIRRMCELVGLKVIGLKRVRIGNILLKNLPEGKWRFLNPDEIL